MPLNLIIFGPPGSGKGTQSIRIAKKHNLQHVSTGEIFRKEIEDQTEIGITAKKFVDQGLLIPDDITISKIMPLIEHNMGGEGFVFDGFPRTIYQAEALDQLLQKKNTSVNLAIFINVELCECLNRMIGRSIDSGRSDDIEAIMLKRMDVYDTNTKPLIEYYQRQGKYSSISGMAPVDIVSAQITNIIDKHLELANFSK